MKQSSQLRLISKAQWSTMTSRTMGNLAKMVREWLPVWRSGMGVEGHDQKISDENVRRGKIVLSKSVDAFEQAVAFGGARVGELGSGLPVAWVKKVGKASGMVGQVGV